MHELARVDRPAELPLCARAAQRALQIGYTGGEEEEGAEGLACAPSLWAGPGSVELYRTYDAQRISEVIQEEREKLLQQVLISLALLVQKSANTEQVEQAMQKASGEWWGGWPYNLPREWPYNLPREWPPPPHESSSSSIVTGAPLKALLRLHESCVKVP